MFQCQNQWIPASRSPALASFAGCDVVWIKANTKLCPKCQNPIDPWQHTGTPRYPKALDDGWKKSDVMVTWLSWFYYGFYYRFCLLSRKTNSLLWKNLSLMGKSPINGPCYTCSTCSMAMWFTWDCWGEEWRLHVPRRPVSFLGQLTWW